MRSFLLGLSIAFSLAFASPSAAAAAQDPLRVLMVVSGEGRDDGKTRPGYEFDEFAQAWLIFRDNGLAVDIASPAGGAVVPDRYNPALPFNERVLADADAIARLADTRSTAKLAAGDYAAVFVVGGKGAMFDLPRDAALQALLADIHERGGIVSAVCHGPAALVDVRLSDGRALLAGKAVTGFSNEEETVFGKRWVKEYPFLLEDALRARGAQFEAAPLMQPRVVIDGRVMTGQNPYSTPRLAEAVVVALGRTPVAREPWRDEHSMALVERLLAGEADAARDALAQDTARYHVELIGMLGYYQLQAAQDTARVRAALAIMELAAPHMAEPQLQLGIAQAHHRLGDTDHARSILTRLLEAKPDMAEASQLMAELDDAGIQTR
ncbi:MAG: DJ-1/PfpI family protein [Pseudomonadota bacterium]|nr:DJ-1/PfpI family protein [Pseudomonadota bacterium]